MKNITIKPEIRAIIFDCDGTLVDSMPMHMKAWENSIRRFQSDFNKEYLFSLRGMKETDIVNSYNRKFGLRLNPEEVVFYKHEYVMKKIKNVKAIEPVVNVAKNHYGKLPLAVVSGSSREIVTEELNVTGIIGLFDIILTADDPLQPKPSPEIFRAAASDLKVEPMYCIVLEDGESGLQGAAAAGMQTIDVREYL